ncbi:MAG: hypothetical protein AAGD86_13645, partial [Pseudomonadota bacterium]
WLFDIASLKIAAAPLGIAKIDAAAGSGRVEFAADTAVDPMTVIGLVQRDPERYSLDGPERLRFRGTFDSPPQRFAAVQKLLERLGAGSAVKRDAARAGGAVSR